MTSRGNLKLEPHSTVALEPAAESQLEHSFSSLHRASFRAFDFAEFIPDGA